MSSSPKTNKSFLHKNGQGKSSLHNERVVYATLDKLALGRARLPLQLLPFQDHNVIEKDSMDCKVSEQSFQRPSFQIKSNTTESEKCKLEDCMDKVKNESEINNVRSMTNKFKGKSNVTHTITISNQNSSNDHDEIEKILEEDDCIKSKDVNNFNDMRITKETNDTKDIKSVRSIKEIKEELIESSKNFSNRIHSVENNIISEKSIPENLFLNRNIRQITSNEETTMVASLNPLKKSNVEKKKDARIEKLSQDSEKPSEKSKNLLQVLKEKNAGLSRVSEKDLRNAILSLRALEKHIEESSESSERSERNNLEQIQEAAVKNSSESSELPEQFRNSWLSDDKNLSKVSETCLRESAHEKTEHESIEYKAETEQKDKTYEDSLKLQRSKTPFLEASKDSGENLEERNTSCEITNKCLRDSEQLSQASENDLRVPEQKNKAFGKPDEEKFYRVVEEEKEVFEVIEPIESFEKSKCAHDKWSPEKVNARLEESYVIVESCQKIPVTNISGMGKKKLKKSATGSETSCSSLCSDGSDSCSNKKKGHFAKNVFHYVPGTLVKHPKKLKTKYKLSYSMTSLRSEQSDLGSKFNLDRSTSLSREELKYVTISSPTNFVHVASATNSRLLANGNYVKSSLERTVITHEQKCATLPLLIGRCEYPMASGNGKLFGNQDSADKAGRMTYVQIKNNGPTTVSPAAEKMNETDEETQEIYEPMSDFITVPKNGPSVNSSFLWSNQLKNILQSESNLHNINEADENYDYVGPSNFSPEVEYPIHFGQSISSGNAETSGVESDEWIYDDVTVPVSEESATTANKNQERTPEVDKAKTMVNLLRKKEDGGESADGSLDNNSRKLTENDASLSKQPENILGDYSLETEDHYLVVNNEYSSVDGMDDEDDNNGKDKGEDLVYDDVEFPREERVNSLYAGSTLWSTLTNGEESEWEDLEDSPSLSRKNCTCGKKKNRQQRWSRKVRRQRSKRSRMSWRSSTRTVQDSLVYVAVSLGSGSVLIIGCGNKFEGQQECQEQPEADTGKWRKSGEGRANPRRTQGLVQIRVVNLDETMDTQEASCYVHEDAVSEDSNYETVNSVSSDSTSASSDAPAIPIELPEQIVEEKSSNFVNYIEAPTKPMPPPPREASLTQTIGKRMKMLRRTWSITKGSLGRIRRRTSVEDENIEEKDNKNSEHHSMDNRKYFSFKKHFRKNSTSLSTFYLHDENMYGNCGSKNNDRKEPKFSNNNWYSQQIMESRNVADPLRSNEANFINDHYSTLTEEPLYQFYAAAAARDAFEFDSDGYEEVENVNSISTSIDLARPGHRTLWCQTPQVIDSGLLKNLTIEEKKIQEAKFEIITSEASYLNSLRVLQNEFLNNCELTNDILTPAEKDKLFGGVPSVLLESERFLIELETVWKEDLMLHSLSDVLLKYADRCLDIYVSYCSNQVTIDTALKDLRSRKGHKFLDMISQIETRPACQSLSLHSFLMLPMQRITRLPLLADAVLSKLSMEHEERPLWEKVLSNFSYIVAECNEGARLAAQIAEMEALAKKLEYPSKIKPISLIDRCLVRSGQLVQLSSKADIEYKLTFGKRFQKVPLYLLLLTDYLLVTKLKHNTHEETYSVIDACKRNLITLEPVSEESPFAGKNAMMLTLLENHSGRQAEYVLMCESATERERWLGAVSPPNSTLVGETLYETWDCPQVMALYSYSPAQPDELPLQPGDIINVLRKMADGWYYGEKLLQSEQGWFPGNYTKEVASEHVRARNLKQRHRLLALSQRVLQRKGKANIAIR